MTANTRTKARLKFIKKYMIGILTCIVLDTGLKVHGQTGFIVKKRVDSLKEIDLADYEKEAR